MKTLFNIDAEHLFNYFISFILIMIISVPNISLASEEDLSSELKIVKESISQRGIGTDRDVDIARYNFFSEKSESVYKEFETGKNNEVQKLTDTVFNEDLNRINIDSGTDKTNKIKTLFVEVQEYKSGRYTEEKDEGKENLIAISILISCAILSFALTIIYQKWKIKKKG